MAKKPKSIAGKFNPEEVEAIEKICDELDEIYVQNQITKPTDQNFMCTMPDLL